VNDPDRNSEKCHRRIFTRWMCRYDNIVYICSPPAAAARLNRSYARNAKLKLSGQLRLPMTPRPGGAMAHGSAPSPAQYRSLPAHAADISGRADATSGISCHRRGLERSAAVWAYLPPRFPPHRCRSSQARGCFALKWRVPVSQWSLANISIQIQDALPWPPSWRQKTDDAAAVMLMIQGLRRRPKTSALRH